MRKLSMLLVMTAMVFVAAGSARGDNNDGNDNGNRYGHYQPPPPPPPPPPPSRSCPHGPVNDDTPNGNCGQGNNSQNP